MSNILRKLVVAATLFRFALGDQPQSWKNVPVDPPPTTVTTTVYSEKTVYVPVTTEKVIPTTLTTTLYQVKPTTITTTVYEVKPTTITTTVVEAKPTTITTTVYQAAPTTVTQVRTDPVTVHVTTTIYATIVNSQTLINTVTSVDTKYQTNIATSVQTVTVINNVPTTIVAPCTTSNRTLTGLVLCPSRIINPTYTPSTPLPSNYLWGCAPGYICQPKQENCNFEQNLPAKSYICSPDQCKKAKPLPSLEEIKALVNRGPTCAWLTPVDGYFNLDPRPWGLTYAIFNIFGQPTCPALPPPSTSTTSSSWATWSPPPPPPPPSSSNWGTWSESTKSSETPSKSSSNPTAWQDWRGWQSPSAVASQSETWASKVTPRAILQKRDEYYPADCYQFCNYALEVWQSVGNEAAQLCPQNGPFSSALSALTSCSSVSGTAGATLIGITSLEDAKAVCNRSPSTAGLLKPRGVSSSTTVAPAQKTAQTMSILSVPASTATGAAQSSSVRAAARPSSQVSGLMAMLFSFLAFILNI